jgi:hypothetical protein
MFMFKIFINFFPCRWRIRLDTRKVNVLEYKFIWKLLKPLVNLKVGLKLFHDLKLLMLEVIMAFVFLELGRNGK